MNPPYNTVDKMTPKHVVENLLSHIRSLFYNNQHKLFYQHRKYLIYAITQPAHWLHSRTLHTTPIKYQQLLTNIIQDIHQHGNTHLYQQYLPRYLLKCIQQHLSHQGDKLYHELKHLRHSIEHILYHIDKKTLSTNRQDSRFVENMAQLHSICKPKKITKSDPLQLELF